MLPLVFLIKILLHLTLFCSSPESITCQQPYVYSLCAASSSYACNGLHKSCETYIIFLARPPYSNASSIATLLGSDASQIAHINNVFSWEFLVPNQRVIVPINCSCSGGYYQSITNYVVQDRDTDVSSLAKGTFQELTTCEAIQNNRGGEGTSGDIYPDEELVIPLKCACPTKNQTVDGISYLVTYVIRPGDTLSSICDRFGADLKDTTQANEINGRDIIIIMPSTTLLLPLRNPPNASRLAQSSPLSPPLLMHRYDPVFLCLD